MERIHIENISNRTATVMERILLIPIRVGL